MDKDFRYMKKKIDIEELNNMDIIPDLIEFMVDLSEKPVKLLVLTMGI